MFLEKFAIEHFDSSKLKAKCKLLITEYNEKLIATTSQLEMSTKLFQSLKQPKEVKFPIKSKTDSERNREIAIQNEYTRK